MKSTAQEIADIEKEVTELKHLFRVGTVQNIDESSLTVRVAWSNGMRSAWLKVPQRGDTWLPAVGDIVYTLHVYGGDGDGIVLGTCE